jgi:hypothetical protein
MINRTDKQHQRIEDIVDREVEKVLTKALVETGTFLCPFRTWLDLYDQVTKEFQPNGDLICPP